MKERIIADIKNLFEMEEKEGYYKTVRVGNFFGDTYIDFGSNNDRNKTLSIEEYPWTTYLQIFRLHHSHKKPKDSL